jgi:hypothetical protein
VRLLNFLEDIDRGINDIVEVVPLDKCVPLYRYYRQQLGEAIIEREQEQWTISKLLDFEEKYFPKNNENRKLPDFLETAKKFISILGETVTKSKLTGNSADSPSLGMKRMKPEEKKIMSTFEEIMDKLQSASDDLSRVTGLPSGIPKNKRITLKEKAEYE